MNNIYGRTLWRCCRSKRDRFSLLRAVAFVLPLLLWIIWYSILVPSSHHAAQLIQLPVSRNTRLISKSVFVKSTLKSDKRGYVALLYSGTARSFSANWNSHIVNLMAGCPYTVHLFFHTYINDNRYSDQAANSSYANYLSVNATLAYFEGYINLDNERVLFRDAVKANVFEYVSLEALREMYADTYDISMKRFPGYPPITSIYYMWHSQRRSEELRQEYMTTTGIDYMWTFRMRHDVVYYTNWWQRAFDVKVYSPANPVHKNISHDVFGDWGVRHTRLYDMVYEPKLQMNNVLYVPLGWSWFGYNDQFAAMSSINANHYFTRILHVDRILREEQVHPEISIRLVARWNNMTVNNVEGTICYDIVRTSLNITEHTSSKNQRKRTCTYKGSGMEDCDLLCPKVEKINSALRESFVRDTMILAQNVTINSTQIKALLIDHLSRVNNDTVQIDYNASSFYYFYRYITSKHANDPACMPSTWPKDQSNIYAMQYLPFILRASDQTKIAMYNKHLTCGSDIDIPIQTREKSYAKHNGSSSFNVSLYHM